MATATATLYPSSLAAWAIEAYQRFISPYKGFRCAHRTVHGRDSCSQFAKRVAVKRGVLAMFSLLRRRFTECSVAAQVLDYESREARRRRTSDHSSSASSSSNCDVSPCDCDVPGNAISQCTPDTGDCAPADCGGVDVGLSGADCAGGADCGGCDF